MASQSEEAAVAETQAFIERIISSRNRDLSLFIPFLVSLHAATSSPEHAGPDPADEDQDSPPDNSNNQRDRIILINPATQGMLVIEGANLRSMVESLPVRGKDGQPPASKASIAAMPIVGVLEEEGECTICLGEWEVGGVAKEMPCKHRFHGGCIEKWLEIHGSCPICRYRMPVDEGEDDGKKVGGDGVEAEEGRQRSWRRGENEVWVSFLFGGAGGRRRRSSRDADRTASTHSDSDPSTGAI